jgi:hypothetical protein
MKEKEKK